MFFSRILRQAAAHGHEPVIWVWERTASDGIVSKAVPTLLAASAAGSVGFAVYSLLFTEPGN